MKLLEMKYLAITSILIFFSLNTIAQTFETERVTITKEEKKGDSYELVETLLCGEEARLFDWKDYRTEPVKIIIRRKREVEIDEKNSLNLTKSPADQDLLSGIHRISAIDDTGDENVYLRTENDWIEENELQGIHFRLTESLDKEARFLGLPNLYLQRYWNQKDRKPQLLWSDSGECPDEYAETDLPEGEIRISFQTQDKKTLFRRSIVTTLIPLEEWQEVRIVEIEDEHYIR